MTLSQPVVERLLIAKNLLDTVRFSTISHPDHFTLAKHILTAHDAAELSIAGIAHHLDLLPPQKYLMNYITKIEESTTKPVPGKEFCSQLNDARNGIKHVGNFPSSTQWHRVGEKVYDYVSQWCQKYLNLKFDTLNEDVLIIDPQVKAYLKQARDAFDLEQWKEVLEYLAFALESLFQNSQALRNLQVGSPRAEDAIKLSTFGVHANDFLTLQEFLPSLVYGTNHSLQIKWKQEEFGHPANWTRDTVYFCLKTFVAVALRIQDAEWIPGAVDFHFVYTYKITAKENNVEILKKINSEPKHVLRTLKKGEYILVNIYKEGYGGQLLESLQGKKSYLSINIPSAEKLLFGESGEVDPEKVHVTCVPLDSKLVREYYSNLPEIDFIP